MSGLRRVARDAASSDMGGGDYTLAQRALLREFKGGLRSRLGICDAHPQLLRAARSPGAPGPVPGWVRPGAGAPPAGSKSGAAGGRNGHKGRQRGFFRRFWWLFLVVPVVLVAAVFGTLLIVYSRLSIPTAPPGPQTTF